MSRQALVVTLLTLLLSVVPAPGAPPTDGGFRGLVEFDATHFHPGEPDELQFSDAQRLDGSEEALAEQLAGEDPPDRLHAAAALWRGHSRRHATEVLKFLADLPPGGEPFRSLQREVDAALRPTAIGRELRCGDRAWGAWLAFLRPHPDLVPALLTNLKSEPALRPAVLLALGNSGDARAMEPLTKLLGGKDYVIAGWAAQALGYLGDPNAEPSLIAALTTREVWVQVQACDALARMGTRRSVPALKRVAEDASYTGALNARGTAARAIDLIEKRAASEPLELEK